MAHDQLSQTMHFALISPEAKLFDAAVYEVTCPGMEGVFGVRAGHMPLMAGLKPGVLRIRENEDAAELSMFITGGFADVTPEQCTVLAEQAIPLSELNRDDLARQAANAREDLAAANDNAARAAAQNALELAEAKLAALG